MSFEQDTIIEPSRELLAPTSGSHTTTLMDLPNELLTSIVEFIGPPDLLRCDPGWFVVPAVCRRLLEVTEKIEACWGSGDIVGPDGNVQEKYGWRTRDHFDKVDIPAGTPDRIFEIHDKQEAWKLSFSLVYKGGNTKYYAASFTICPGGYRLRGRDDRDDENTIQAMDRYFSGSPLHALPRPNLTWLSKLCISHYGEHINQDRNFSFADVPCIVAPALQTLWIYRYVVNWRCSNLRELVIYMSPSELRQAPSKYRYPPLELFARLHDSRRTLENVKLGGCLQTVPDDNCHRRCVHADEFPSLREFNIEDEPRKAGWLCARIGFPITCPPFININREPAMDSLRLIACGYGHSVHDPKPALPGFHGELDALTFRAGSIVTASSITGVCYQDSNLERYAKRHTAGYMEFGSAEDVKSLDGQVPGIVPKFVTRIKWTLGSVNNPLPSDDLCGARCSALHGIKHVFIEGFDTRLFHSDSSAEVWTNILRHLPNVRSLYVYAPCSASLAPLINEPDLLPALRTLWLGCDNESKGDDDADGDSSDSETDYDSESGYDSEGGNYSEEVYDLQNEDNGAEHSSTVESIDELTEDDGLKRGDDTKASCEPMNGGDKDAPAPTESRFTGPKPKARRIDARTLIDIMRRRKQMEVQLVNLTIVGDHESIQACERLWKDGRIIVRTAFRV